MSNYNNGDDTIDAVFGFLLLILVVGVIIFGFRECQRENDLEEKLGKETYEIVITDKYDCLGSSYHLIGGRSTETEFHICYKYRCTNRPNDTYKSAWKVYDKEVSHTTWTKYNIGDNFTTQYDPLYCL